MWKIPQSNDITKKTTHMKPDIDSCSSLTESKTVFYSFPSNAVIGSTVLKRSGIVNPINKYIDGLIFGQFEYL